MVCVLQSKLPWSSAVFQLYCQPFFFPLKPFTIYTFYSCNRALSLLFTSVLHLFEKFIFGHSLYVVVEEMRLIFRFRMYM